MPTTTMTPRPSQPFRWRPPGSNSLAQAIFSQGAQACATRVSQVTSFLGATSSTGAVLMVPENAPNQRLFPLSMEVTTPHGSAYVSATFAPNQINGCGAAYDAVMYWPENCALVASTEFSAIRNVGALGRFVTVLDGGPGTKIFLMPAGGGCVSIKKEVVL